jgi:hypothetical protein
MFSSDECSYVSGSLTVTYLKTLIGSGNFPTTALSMDTDFGTLDSSTCQGNSPLFVLLNSNESTQHYLEQVNISSYGTMSLF